jgi:hypothetical protein
MTATMNIPNIKLLEKVGKRVILSMDIDMYEYISEDIEMLSSREKLIKNTKTL